MASTDVVPQKIEGFKIVSLFENRHDWGNFYVNETRKAVYSNKVRLVRFSGARLKDTQLQGIFTDIIEGKIVKRSKHELRWEGRDVTMEFIQALHEHGYDPAIVARIDIAPGERVPAFYIDEGFAYFGWVFWEKFSQLKLRKLFGSVVRNTKGDWAVQIPDKRKTVIYANPGLKTEMDIDNVSGF